MMKYSLATGVAAVVLAACGGEVDTVPAEPKDVPAIELEASASGQPGAESIPAITEREVAAPADDTSISFNSEALSAAANIDGDIADFSQALSDRIKSNVEAEIEVAKSDAAEDEKNEYFTPHDYQADYIKTASVGDIISIESLTMTYSGGAHPNYVISGLIHDRAAGEDISGQALLSDDGQSAMKALLMEELAGQKLKRMSMEAEDMPILRDEVAEIFPTEIDRWFGEVTLVPSLEAGKFGGLVVHYSPYDVGAYAEGSYDILVSAAQLDGMLSDTYAPLFGGEPDIEVIEEH